MASRPSERPSGLIQPITVSPEAKQHPLFPILNLMTRQGQQNKDLLIQLMKQQQRDLEEIKDIRRELSDLMKQQARDSFSLKQAGFEEMLRIEIAGVFCESLTREVTDRNLQKCIRKVLKDDATTKYKFDLALRYLKRQFSTFKAEERRKILGISPFGKYAKMPSRQLAEAIITYMHAPEAMVNIYVKHLALLRKFVRETDATSHKQLYSQFKEWLRARYNQSDYPSTEEWRIIIEEDSLYDYSNTVINDETIVSVEMTSDDIVECSETVTDDIAEPICEALLL